MYRSLATLRHIKLHRFNARALSTSNLYTRKTVKPAITDLFDEPQEFKERKPTTIELLNQRAQEAEERRSRLRHDRLWEESERSISEAYKKMLNGTYIEGDTRNHLKKVHLITRATQQEKIDFWKENLDKFNEKWDVPIKIKHYSPFNLDSDLDNIYRCKLYFDWNEKTPDAEERLEVNKVETPIEDILFDSLKYILFDEKERKELEYLRSKRK